MANINKNKIILVKFRVVLIAVSKASKEGMFPRISLLMVMASGGLMTAGCLVNYLTGNSVNIWLLGLGLLMLIYGTGMLLFYRPK